jgi:hypothetical protein
MSIYLRNYLGGLWQPPARAVHTLLDPVSGEVLAQTGGAAPRAMRYGQLGSM